MTCYKLVTCEFKWFGFQNKVESLIQRVSPVCVLLVTFNDYAVCRSHVIITDSFLSPITAAARRRSESFSSIFTVKSFAGSIDGTA